MRSQLLGLAADDGRQDSAHGHLITAAARSVSIGMGVTAHKPEQSNVVDVGALALIEPHLARHPKREKASSQSLALWLAHTNVRANRQGRDKLGQPQRKARTSQPSRLQQKSAHLCVEVVRLLHIADVSRPVNDGEFRIGN